MLFRTLFLVVRHHVSTIIKQKTFYFLWGVYLLLLVYAMQSGWKQMYQQNTIRSDFQKEVRKSWLSNPDKHPHRMAHFGSFALRLRHPVSSFDFGMENYVGNAVFMEAHKQNSVNFSEASFSTGMQRMGELSVAMLLQIVLPLILFFLGFGSIAGDRENGTLKLIKTQGVSMLVLLLGRSLAIWVISLLFLVPAAVGSGWLAMSFSPDDIRSDVQSRILLIFLFYCIFLAVLSVITVCVSARSISSQQSLIRLLGIWLILGIIVPRISQVFSETAFRSPSKLEFESAIENDIVKQGDSHNPDDPYFKRIKDSVMQHYQVNRVDSLPVNLGGIVSKAGEKLSAETYVKHHHALVDVYRKQNFTSVSLGMLNPFIPVKSLSMALAGSDFDSYVNFQSQVESYRYKLAQKMNDLQIEHVSNDKPAEGSHVLHIDRDYWGELEDFNMKYLTVGEVLDQQKISLLFFIWWIVMVGCWVWQTARTLKV